MDPAPLDVGMMAVTVTKYNHKPHQGTTVVAVPAVVTIEPGTVPVGQTTPVIITVQDTLTQGMQDVVVTISGWGLEVTDVTGIDG